MKTQLRNDFLSNRWRMLVLLGILSISQTFALTGNLSVHDPSTIVKSGNKYYTFSTGGGIPIKSSTDLVNWTQSGSVFGNSFPNWIKTYAPNFAGNFWAPDILFMNNRYYLYYSCYDPQLAKHAAIGVASTPTLDQSSPNYKWTDHGMVVWSNSTTNKQVITIDPGLLMDNGRVYMAYGTYGADIGVVEIDPTTGKIKAGDVRSLVSHNAEAAALIKKDTYYYLINNHGSCCSGVNSGYYMTMGRSTSPKGPFLDKNGVSLMTSYGSDLLRKNGKYIGPGHFGLLRENGIEVVSYHYYDGNNGGAPTLGIGKLEWSNGWPSINQNAVIVGSSTGSGIVSGTTYTITARHSGKNLDVNAASTLDGADVIQWMGNANATNQQWVVTDVGGGYYTFRSVRSGKYLDVLEASTADGGNVVQWSGGAGTNQQFQLVSVGSGYYQIKPRHSGKCLDVLDATTDNGGDVIQWTCNGSPNQSYSFTQVGATARIETESVETKPRLLVFPNPSASTYQVVEKGAFTYQIRDYTGTIQEKGAGIEAVTVGNHLSPGVYLLQIVTPSGTKETKLIKQ